VSVTTTNIIAIVLLVVFLPAILRARFVHPLFLLLLLVTASSCRSSAPSAGSQQLPFGRGQGV